MQISNIFTKLSNTLTIPNGKNHNATPDPWNLRFAHEDFWSSKVEIRHELSTSLKDQAGDAIIVDVKNDYDMKEFDPTIADEKDFKLEVNELETVGSINDLFLDLKELKRSFFRYEWLDLDNYNLDESVKDLFTITSDSHRFIDPIYPDAGLLGGYEKKVYHIVTTNKGDKVEGWIIHAHVHDVEYGDVYIDINRIRYTLHANRRKDDKGDNYATIQLSLADNFSLLYEKNRNRITNLNHKMLAVKDIYMGIQHKGERDVFTTSMLSGVFSKRDNVSMYKFFGPIAKKIPYLNKGIGKVEDLSKFINTYKDLFLEDKVKQINSAIGQEYDYGLDYEGQKATADSLGTVPVQLLVAESKAYLITPESNKDAQNDFMRLKGGIYMDDTEIGYTAYFMLDYSVGKK
jgi:hypothetical protein